ncbi:DUF4907 domain-containing protein [Aureibaculum algae]|uniref:DUF4907 domain-containing protein n=1 Tax=Aureibaculum algae TaxID=2584122 RepID=A0A5B7TX06_9FLAO|nr:DUF4907 domain-containing protein [Aureibaculum algae]QCX39222.1 DUF4907 domain-containing protein [Aureibaculum algae]
MKNRFLIISFVILLTTIIVFFINKSNTFEPASKSYSIETFKIDDGWGYKILKDDKIFIKQNFIPAVKGNRPFVSEMEAYNTANLVIIRLDQNKLPTITIAELNSIGVTLLN